MAVTHTSVSKISHSTNISFHPSAVNCFLVSLRSLSHYLYRCYPFYRTIPTNAIATMSIFTSYHMARPESRHDNVEVIARISHGVLGDYDGNDEPNATCGGEGCHCVRTALAIGVERVLHLPVSAGHAKYYPVAPPTCRAAGGQRPWPP